MSSEHSEKGETPERKKKSRKEKTDEDAEEHKRRRAERAEKLRRAEQEVEERKRAAEAEALKQREAEAAAAAAAPKLAEPDADADLASLEAAKPDAGAGDTLELFPRAVYESFAQLQRHTRELNLAMAVPEVVLVGPHGAQKSYLLEAILGRVFNGCVAAASHRPLVVHAVNSVKGERFVLKRDGVLRDADRDVEISADQLATEIAHRNETPSPEPIVLQVEGPELLTMSVVDTPGLILDPADPQSKPNEQLALRAIAPTNRLIVLVRSSADAAMPPTASDYVLDLIKQVDPEFTRTVIVHTRLYQQLQSFQAAKAVNRFLAGTVPDVRTFFLTLPAAGLREKLAADPAAFREKMLQAQRRDLTLLESLQYDKRYQQSVGVAPVVRHIHGFAWRAYQEAAPRIIKILRQRKSDAAHAIAENTAQAEALTPAFFRVVASDYTMEFLRTLERLIRGTAEGNPAVHGQTLEQEKALCGVDAQWVDIRGIPVPVEPDEWEVPHWQNRLYGGQQFERLLAEFKAVSDHTEIPELTRDDIATAAGIPKLHNVPNFTWAACDLARQKSQEAFEPLVNQLTERAVYVVKRLSEVAESMMTDSLARRRGSAAANASSSDAPKTSQQSSQQQQQRQQQQRKVDATNAETYPYFVHFVKDQFFKFVDETAKRCKELCMDEFYTTRTIFWDLTENEHVPTVERTEQVADLARSLFRRLRERITRNVLLKFYNHLLVPVETRLWPEMQRRVSELSDKALEDLFEAPSVRDALANAEIKFKADLKEFEDREKVLLEVASSFSHPVGPAK